jgi:hypothetical protein
MTPNDYQFQATSPEGRIQVLQLAKLNENANSTATAHKPLVVKTQAGFQYKLMDPDTGTHLKGQKLLRSNKNLQVLLDDRVALELQDYFVASVAPLPNAPVYKLENQSCEEVQVTANLPKEALRCPRVWSGPSGTMHKVAKWPCSTQALRWRFCPQHPWQPDWVCWRSQAACWVWSH